MMKNKALKGVLVLVILTLLSGVSLGAVNAVTKEPIARAEEEKKTEAYRIVSPGADTFKVTEDADPKEAAAVLEAAGFPNDTIDEVVTSYKGEKTAGYVITVTDSAGYGGDIRYTVGLDTEGVITGITFLSLSESPGLGMEARDDPDWRTQFIGRSKPDLTVVKTGEAAPDGIDALSGATITSKAVTSGVNAVLTYYREVLQKP